jgi:hypothetical protein
MDGQQWFVASFKVNRGGFWLSPPTQLTDSLQVELQSFINADDAEPLAHRLLHEAWEHRVRSPRSALVIGVAAAEVGFKQFVAEQESKAAWLVEEMPSPPLERMLRKYLPILLSDREEFPIREIPKQTVTVIKKAIESRNVVAHKPATASARYQEIEDWLDKNELSNALLAISDLLFLLDYYRGHEWALDHVRDETLQAWRASTPTST